MKGGAAALGLSIRRQGFFFLVFYFIRRGRAGLRFFSKAQPAKCTARMG